MIIHHRNQKRILFERDVILAEDLIDGIPSCICEFVMNQRIWPYIDRPDTIDVDCIPIDFSAWYDSARSRGVQRHGIMIKRELEPIGLLRSLWNFAVACEVIEFCRHCLFVGIMEFQMFPALIAIQVILDVFEESESF